MEAQDTVAVQPITSLTEIHIFMTLKYSNVWLPPVSTLPTPKLFSLFDHSIWT